LDWLKRHQRGEDLEESLKARDEVTLAWPAEVDPLTPGAAAAFLDEQGLNLYCAGTWHRPPGATPALTVTLLDPPGGPAESLSDATGRRVPARHFVRDAHSILGLHHGDGRLTAWWWSTPR